MNWHKRISSAQRPVAYVMLASFVVSSITPGGIQEFCATLGYLMVGCSAVLLLVRRRLEREV